MEVNRDPKPSGTGLQTLCNNFYGVDSDILIGGYGTPNFNNDHIRKIQGSPYQSAGNQFYNNNTFFNIRNNKHDIDYYYNPQNPAEYPALRSANVFPYTASPNGCPSKLGNIIVVPIEKGLAQYEEWNEEYEYWAAKEGKDEDTVILHKVSYFSSLKDNYFNSIVVAASFEEEEMVNTALKLESLRALFLKRGQYADYLSMVETFLAQNSFEEALKMVASMYEKFEPEEEELLELLGLQTYIYWLQQLNTIGKTIYTLQEEDLNELISYANTYTGKGAIFAKIILCELYDICIEAEGGRRKAISKIPLQILKGWLAKRVGVVYLKK